MKKRVVIFSAFLSPMRSGAEACAEEIALHLCDRFDITIITAKMRSDLPRRDMLQGKVPVIRVGFGFTFDKWLYPFFAPFAARKLKPDVLHAVLETFAGVALHMCKAVIPGAKQILTLQTTNRHFLRKHIMRTPHIITAISTVLADQAKELGRNDVIVIPNGIPYDQIRKVCETTRKVRGRILFVGRLEKMKGVDVLLKAFDRIQGPSLHIVGSGSQYAALHALARELGLADPSASSGQSSVTFTGYLSGIDLNKEYAEAEIFCGLSRSEALGNVFLEAQAANCAVIATNVGGIPEIITDGETGLLVPPDDPDAAAKAMKTILEDDQLFAKLAHRGEEHAKEFDWKNIVEQYAQLY